MLKKTFIILFFFIIVVINTTCILSYEVILNISNARWNTNVDKEHAPNLIIKHSKLDDGVIEVTLSGVIPYNHERWHANISYNNNVMKLEKGKYYRYKIEMWTKSGTRDIDIEYFDRWNDIKETNNDDDSALYQWFFPTPMQINQQKQTFILETPQAINDYIYAFICITCGDKLGTFYINVLSIEEIAINPVKTIWTLNQYLKDNFLQGDIKEFPMPINKRYNDYFNVLYKVENNGISIRNRFEEWDGLDILINGLGLTPENKYYRVTVKGKMLDNQSTTMVLGGNYGCDLAQQRMDWRNTDFNLVSLIPANFFVHKFDYGWGTPNNTGFNIRTAWNGDGENPTAPFFISDITIEDLGPR